MCSSDLTALELESDRMTDLAITPGKLAAEKRVVVEEFRQRYLNQPYGDQTMLLRALAYRKHPYRWATIGLTPDLRPQPWRGCDWRRRGWCGRPMPAILPSGWR